MARLDVSKRKSDTINLSGKETENLFRRRGEYTGKKCTERDTPFL